jgi:hypothetical protein
MAASSGYALLRSVMGINDPFGKTYAYDVPVDPFALLGFKDPARDRSFAHLPSMGVGLFR